MDYSLHWQKLTRQKADLRGTEKKQKYIILKTDDQRQHGNTETNNSEMSSIWNRHKKRIGEY
jgi:hypothetical protein